MAKVNRRAGRLSQPQRVVVKVKGNEPPRSVAGKSVDAVRETWLIEDRWWTNNPIRRRYWELVTEEGRNVVVYRDLESGGWFAQ